MSLEEKHGNFTKKNQLIRTRVVLLQSKVQKLCFRNKESNIWQNKAVKIYQQASK